jgi:hypothetical protein
MMKTRFESQFKNFGELRIKRWAKRSSFTVSSIQAPIWTQCSRAHMKLIGSPDLRTRECE